MFEHWQSQCTYGSSCYQHVGRRISLTPVEESPEMNPPCNPRTAYQPSTSGPFGQRNGTLCGRESSDGQTEATATVRLVFLPSYDGATNTNRPSHIVWSVRHCRKLEI